MHNKLTSKWFGKLQKGETIGVSDLYEFSKVSLKRKRIRKKFDKKYHRYVSENIYEAYIGILFATPMIGSFQKILDFDIEIVPLTHSIGGNPVGKLLYTDHIYEDIPDRSVKSIQND